MAAPKLVLYDFPAQTRAEGWESFSPFVLQCHRALRLAKLPFEHKQVDILRELRKVNPLGQLPVLGVGDELVPDSTRILQRIEALRPGSMTGGLDERALAEAWLWEEFADTALYPYVLTTRWADERGWPVPREAFFSDMPWPLRSIVPPMVRRKTINKLIGRDFLRDGIERCYERMRRVLDQLDTRAPDTGFWMGPRACVADLGLFAHLHSLRLPTLAWQAEEVAKRKRLSAYLDRVHEATR
ncbi:MAG TPA: glutathione S-transferase family protein, partial [Polyangiales bacterium]|nr:glutathione S-transferase family protein [Polyangiales bacterium]